MKKFPTLLLLCLALTVLTQTNFSQETSNPSSKEPLKKIAEKRAKAGGFVVLTPLEFKALTAGLGDPCNTATQIAWNQTIQGSLGSGDCVLDDGSYGDFYMFSATGNEHMTVNLSSTAFDTYLGIAHETGAWVAEDDNSGGGTNSRIVADLLLGGNYIILANSFLPAQTGNYTLSLSDAPACSYSLEPTSMQIPGSGGTYSFNVITTPGCYWSVNYDVYSFINFVTSGGQGPGTVSFTADPNTGTSSRSTLIHVAGQTFTLTQDFVVCTYSITPDSVSLGPDAAEYTFTMNTPAGCPWQAQSSAYWLWASSELSRGPGPVRYSVSANNGGNRSGTLTVAGQTFTVQQTGRNCTYSFSPTSVRVSPAGQYGQFTVNTQDGCTWNFSGGYLDMQFPDGYGGTGPGTKSWRVLPATSFGTRNWTISFTGTTSTNIQFTQPGIPYRTRFDFFGDSKADLSFYRPSVGQWLLWDSTTANTVLIYYFGTQGDVPVPGDYNGDRTTDLAVFRPSTGTWYMFNRNNNTYSGVQFGTAEDIPAPADYDGDGKTDVAVFRPSVGVWFILKSSDGTPTYTQFGAQGDFPVPADYDGDGKWDLAIWRPNGASGGEWWAMYSSNGSISAAQFGEAMDKALPGDFTGDGKADFAFYRPSTGYWYILRSEDFSYYGFPFGTNGDVPVPADYDADGQIDAGIFRPSNTTWYINRSAGGPTTTGFASLPGDIPLPNVYVR
jgi:hypothetical protein